MVSLDNCISSVGVLRLGLCLETCLETLFTSLDLFLKCVRSHLGLEEFRSQALSLKTLHE